MDEESIFAEALKRRTPEARAAFLDGACAGNEELRRNRDLRHAGPDHTVHVPDQSEVRGLSHTRLLLLAGWLGQTLAAADRASSAFRFFLVSSL